MNTLEALSNELVNKLFRIGEIDEIQKKRMIKHNTQIPRVYALPKVHKNPITLRHIVSTPGSPSSNLSMLLDNLLKKVIHSQSLSKVRATRNDTLASLDIVALFLSIPMDYVFKLLDEKWDLISQHTKMDKQLFIEVACFVLLDAAVLTHNDTFYRQINGISMGSNTAPAIANLVTNAIFDAIVPKLPFKPKLLVKYVDDILILLPKRFKTAVLQLFN